MITAELDTAGLQFAAGLLFKQLGINLPVTGLSAANDTLIVKVGPAKVTANITTLNQEIVKDNNKVEMDGVKLELLGITIGGISVSNIARRPIRAALLKKIQMGQPLIQAADTPDGNIFIGMSQIDVLAADVVLDRLIISYDFIYEI